MADHTTGTGKKLASARSGIAFRPAQLCAKDFRPGILQCAFFVMRIEPVRRMYVVTASVGSPAFPPAMQKRDPKGNHFDFIFITDMP